MVIAQAAQAGGVAEQTLCSAIQQMVEPLATLIDDAEALGIGALIAPRHRTIENNLNQLRKL